MADTPITRSYLAAMANYNQWMNGKVYETAGKLSPEEIARDRGAFFKSILGTLNHLLVADLVWIDRFKAQDPRVSDMRVLRHEAFSVLRQEREALDAEITAWAAAVDPAWLARSSSFKSRLSGAEFTRPGWVLAMHFFNHQTHHRGQITTLLTQAGQDVGVTDLMVMPGLREISGIAV